jgi:hypothetical protein
MEVFDNMIVETDVSISNEFGIIAFFVNIGYVPMFSIEISDN